MEQPHAGEPPLASKPEYEPQIGHTIWELERKVRRGRTSDATRHALVRAHVEQLRQIEERLDVPPEGRSFALLQERAVPAILMLAGEGQTCENLRPLATRLHARGLSVLATSLAYRQFDRPGVTPTYWQTCLDEAENRYDMLEHCTTEIAVVGVGLGAALALHLAARKRVHAVVALFPILDTQLGLGEQLRAVLRRLMRSRQRTPATWSMQRRLAARLAQEKVAATPVIVVSEDRRDRSDTGRSLHAARALSAHKPVHLILLPLGHPASPDTLPDDIVNRVLEQLNKR